MKTRCRVAKLVLFTVALAGTASFARAPTAAPPPDHPTSTPYSRSTDIFEYPDRARKLQINRVMDILHIGPGRTVADLGAGGGWFTVQAARRVEPGGMVFAEDINPDFVSAIAQRTQRAAHGPQPGTERGHVRRGQRCRGMLDRCPWEAGRLGDGGGAPAQDVDQQDVGLLILDRALHLGELEFASGEEVGDARPE